MDDQFAVTVAKLRQSLLKAKDLELGASNPQEYTLGVVFQIMNECERRRHECLQAQQNHLAQAKAAEYQASAFSMVSSIAQQVYDGFIQAEERAQADRKAREAEKAANTPPAEPEAESNHEPKKKRKG